MNSDELPPPLASVVRAAFLADSALIPTTPGQVAAHDSAKLAPNTATPPPTPSFEFSWEKNASNVIPFPSQATPDALAFAARTRTPISPETRARLSQLLRDSLPKSPDA